MAALVQFSHSQMRAEVHDLPEVTLALCAITKIETRFPFRRFSSPTWDLRPFFVLFTHHIHPRSDHPGEDLGKLLLKLYVPSSLSKPTLLSLAPDPLPVFSWHLLSFVILEHNNPV